MQKMKILQISPPWIQVPPVGYGGTELVIHNLTEELVKRGHDVTLYATGDSKTSAKLDYFYKEALGNDGNLKTNPYHWLFHLYKPYSKAANFDIIHNHAQYISMFFANLVDVPLVHTIHGAFYKDLQSVSGMHKSKRQVLEVFKDNHFISISDNQRIGKPDLNYAGTVYNGINIDDFELGSGEGNYLVWLGRITPNKGVEDCIKVAQETGMRLKIAAFIDSVDVDYFKEKIEPEIDNDQIEFIEEIENKEEKSRFLGEAKAFIFPIQWHEPFGLVMVESMAAGTPVIAYNPGSVPEVVIDGETGFIVPSADPDLRSGGKYIIKESGIAGMKKALKRIDEIDRRVCRRHVKNHFTIEKMVDGYESVYRKVLQ